MVPIHTKKKGQIRVHFHKQRTYHIIENEYVGLRTSFVPITIRNMTTSEAEKIMMGLIQPTPGKEEIEVWHGYVKNMTKYK